MNPNEIAEIIDNMIEKKARNLTSTFKRGVVSAINGQYADVKVEGNTTAITNILSLSSYAPQVGDKVLLVSIGESGANFAILGALKTTKAVDRWTVPTLLNGWTMFDTTYSTIGYIVDSSGFVNFKGMIKGGTGVIFTMPAGLRPLRRMLLSTQSNGGAGRIDVEPNGNVSLNGGTNAWISLDNLRYLAEQ